MSAEKYLNSAKGYLTGLEILTEKLRGQTVDSMGLLASQSIELCLKAYLISIGWDEKQLKTIGHDLVKAWSYAKEGGLSISKEPSFEIQLLAISHDSPYYFRYPQEKIATAIPPPDQLCNEVTNLIEIVENEIKKPNPSKYLL